MIFFFFCVCFLATKAARLEKCFFFFYKNKQDGHRVASFYRTGGVGVGGSFDNSLNDKRKL